MIVSQRASQDCLCRKYVDLLAKCSRLEGENERLRAKLARQERTAKEQPFGLSTPSSKQLIKPSAPELTPKELQRRKGGAPVGHAGHGWKRLDAENEAEVEYLPPLDACPCCGGTLTDFPGDDGSIRELIDCHPLPAFRRRLRVPARYCPHCRKPVRPRVPGVLPKTRLSNQVLARVAGEHYLDGVPMGTVARRLNVPKGTLFHEMHRLAEMLEPAVESLREKFRNAVIKHADETTWRTDGNNGYAWLFTAGPVTIFVCAQSRAMIVAKEMLADSGGTLVTDRYAAYNCFEGNRNYCFEHLKRDTLAVAIENPTSRECNVFVETLVPLLCEAMSLRSSCAGDPITYFIKAENIRYQIETVANKPARHPSVQAIQSIFRENSSRLWHWTTDPRIPAENNVAERAVRPLAIARKVSHGSQSVKGRETRSVIMSVMHTLNACCKDPVAEMVKALNRHAKGRNANTFARLFDRLPLYVPTQ